jgi:cystathionine beta-lyase
VPSELLHDFTDDEARRALPTKWGSVPSDVIPAWIAEMDYAVAPAIAHALRDAVADSLTGYPAFEDGGRLGGAYADFARRHYGQTVDPDLLVPVVDVTAGVRLVLDVLCGPGPMVLQVPAYPPQLQVAQVTGRELVTVPLDPDSPVATIDLDGIDRALAAGGQTVLLTQPHNPLGRCYSREELEGLRDVVTARGARVISDEIHAPLALPGAAHTPYLTLPGTADHAVAVVSTSKAFNTPGLRCAQILSADEATHEALVSVPMVRNDSWSPLGVVGAIAAYEHGDAWLAALIERLDAQRTLLAELLSEHLPEAKMRPLEATYLAWLDLRAYGHDDPADVMLRKGRVCLQTGSHFHPGLTGHARLNIATSPERLSEIARRMASALT